MKIGDTMSPLLAHKLLIQDDAYLLNGQCTQENSERQESANAQRNLKLIDEHKKLSYYHVYGSILDLFVWSVSWKKRKQVIKIFQMY